MNNEREDKEPDKQGSSKETSPENTDVNIKNNIKGNTPPDHVNTDTGGSSEESRYKTMATAESRSLLWNLTETKKNPVLDRFSPTNSAIYVGESDAKKNNLSTIDSANTGTVDSSESVDTTMATMASSTSSGTPYVTKKSPIFDRFSPTNSAMYVRERDTKKNNLSKIDSAHTGTVDSSESADTTIGTTTSSSSSGTPSVTKKSPIFDQLSPTSSAFYVSENDIRRVNSSRAGSNVSSSQGVIKYSSLMAMGISRRKKYFPTESSSGPEDIGEVHASAEAGSPTSSPQSDTQVPPNLCPYDYSKIDNESTAGQPGLRRSGTGSDIHVITESEKKVDKFDIPTKEREIVTHGSLDEVKGQENVKETSETSVSCSDKSSPHIHFMTIPSSERLNTDDFNEIKVSLMGVDWDSSNRILDEAFKQIIQTLEPRKQQQDDATTHDASTTDSSSFEKSAMDNYLKYKMGNVFSDPESSHSRSPVHSSSTGGQEIDVLPAACRPQTPEYSRDSLNNVHSKKSVYFADTVGLELTDIHPVSNSQSPPYIPQSVLDKLMPDFDQKPKEFSEKFLYPCFDQPGADFNFIKKVLRQKVCLENALVSDMTIKGYVRVAKIAPYQSVLVRYSTDDWYSYNEIQATHMSENPDGMTERFSFILEAPPDMQPASSLELVVLLVSNSIEYADCNDGNNYKLQCIQKMSGLLTS